MAQKKLTDYGITPYVSSGDLFLVVRSPNTLPTTNTVTIDSIVGNVTVNTMFGANVVVNSNAALMSVNTVLRVANLEIAAPHTPNTSGDISTPGSIYYDSSYLYITVANNVTKRVALSSF